MAAEMLLRFVIGGAFVSLFALSGDVLRPKSFAGLFGAAPSVALATLALTIGSKGAGYAAIETRSMIGGAAAFFVYAVCASRAMIKWRVGALPAAGLLIVVWMGVALLLWGVWLK
jgi:hypothetical protein